MAQTTMNVRIILVGASYAGLFSLRTLISLFSSSVSSSIFVLPDSLSANGKVIGNVDQEQINWNVSIKVIDRRDGILHLIGSPLAQVEEGYAQKSWKLFKDIPWVPKEGENRNVKVEFLHAEVEEVRMEDKMVSYTFVDGSAMGWKENAEYDFLIGLAPFFTVSSFLAAHVAERIVGVVGTGLERITPVVPLGSLTHKSSFVSQALLPIAPSTKTVLVLGGGAVGVELSTSLKTHYPNVRVLLFHSRLSLLSNEPLPNEFKDKALTMTKEEGVEVFLGWRVGEYDEKKKEVRLEQKEGVGATLGDGLEKDEEGWKFNGVDMVLNTASGFGPVSAFLPREAKDEEGYIPVRATMQFPPSAPNAESHYGAGDVVRWPGIKRVGTSMAMGALAARNLYRSLLPPPSGEEGKKPVYHDGPHDPRPKPKRGEKMEEFPPVKPMMFLEVGSQCLAYVGDEKGVWTDEEIKRQVFEDDLGLRVCWSALGMEVDGTEESVDAEKVDALGREFAKRIRNN
ncbi:hypothetical protein BT69DRAFT_1314900 [Atractiella rhizophila]|nr:hypothetical protein BT69DRAFT_1314900 [Atractiella rhizophila]